MTKMTDSRAVEVLAAIREDGGVVEEADYVEAIDHAIARLCEPAGVGGEWVLVPRKPTEAMHTAHAMHGDTSDWWNAVLAAAPQPPAEAQAVAWVSRNDAMFSDAGNWRYTTPILCSSQESPDLIPLYTAPPSAPGCGACSDGCKDRGSCRVRDESPPSAPVGDHVCRHAGKEGEVCETCREEVVRRWEDFAAAQTPSAPVGVEVDALIRLVEGPGCLRWQDGQGFRLKDTQEWMAFYVAAKNTLAQQPAAVDGARPLDDWHEDDGPAVWWKLPVDEPAWIGTPLDSDWPGYHTHWTPHPAVPALAAQPGGGK